jgi:RNA polymerase sigma factor (sigma-70 family)
MRTNEELIRDYRAGEADALNELAKQNGGLIASHANDWANSGREWDDVFQECSLAFLLAAHAFDPARNRRFSTLASVAMNHHMQNLKVRSQAQKRTAKVTRLHDDLKDRERTPAEIVELRLDAKWSLSLIRRSKTRRIVWLTMQGYTNPEVAKKTGVSFQRISQIKHEGLDQIREICLT